MNSSSPGNIFLQSRKHGLLSRPIFAKAILDTNKTGELTLEQAIYVQAKLVEDITSPLTTKFQHQENIAKSVPPEDSAPPAPEPPNVTGTTEIL